MKRLWWVLMVSVGLLAAGCGTTHAAKPGQQSGYSTALARVQSTTAANVDPGTSMNNRPAPNFTLTDQFGKTVSLSQYRGKVVVLAFEDSECTTICPLTSEEMVMAKNMLGPKAASEVQLLAVDANPTATSVQDVRAYSQAHGTMNSVLFTTGSKQQLSKVWKAYDIYVAIQKGAIDHTPGVYIINSRGQEKKLYLTQMAYAGMGQQAEVLAQEIARNLPHPTKTSKAVLHKALVQEATVHQIVHASLPSATGSGRVQLSDGKPHLLVFVASWLSELSNVPQQMRALDTYQSYARQHGLPSVIAVDEATTEPSPKAFQQVLAQTGHLNYPVAIDTTGAVADKIGVQDITWYALINGQGKVIWAYDGSNNWFPIASLESRVKTILAKKGQG
ncbi:SCO family protein [Sulfobacillus harzensis]|uniref:Redoxin domain-containing protein n=1 Tax=Sulfobacillus harzensis TaxID=2729629 RepID=A0A7Y0Q1B7_9FIRM|nr:SCO family protein [Sulfobacillus harzensis]NMP21933.1 redoxin domain-containing protein [Sulfobacillus harzensis]